MDVREHALLLASTSLTYTFEKLPGLRAMLVAGSGMYLDRYVAQSAPGLLVLHGYGNVFERTLKEGETILVEPGGFLYKDSTVSHGAVVGQLQGQHGGGAAAGGRARPTGDGRRPRPEQRRPRKAASAGGSRA